MGVNRIRLAACGAALAVASLLSTESPRRPAANRASTDAGPILSAPLRDLAARQGTGNSFSWLARAGALGQFLFPRLLAMPSTVVNVLGVGLGFSGPSGSYTVTVVPSDTVVDVGPNASVQAVNGAFAVFDKNGTPILGPVVTRTLWSGFGGGCETNNDWSPIVLYDSIADRWLISQLSVSTTPYLQCVAVSQTPDPTGAYYRYAFPSTDFPDYPKMGVWPDAYYATANRFSPGPGSFLGVQVCAYDRAKMLTGQPATQQCFQTGSSLLGLLPSDLDGFREPPLGSPNYVASLGATANALAYWKFHVDWNNPGNTTLTGPTVLSVAPFNRPCATTSACIPQSGTTNRLDAVGDRIVSRLAYRNFGDHESLVLNHSVAVGSTAVGVRWYELRPTGSGLAVFQQGTYAPDSNYRWMGSIAMDQTGDIALGYSVSGNSLHPEIRYTGRLAGDAVGLMTQGEGTIIAGGGSQTGEQHRWAGSTMTLDPTDDCTFWYTNQYIPADGSFNWSTRVANFRFPNCVPSGQPNDFSIAASPGSLTVSQGTIVTSTINTTVTSGSSQTIALSASGLPAGASATFAPTTVTAGSSSMLTIDTGNAATGTYSVIVTGTGTSAAHTTSIALTITDNVSGLVNGDFELGTLSGWTTKGTASITTASRAGAWAAQVGALTPTNGDSGIVQTFNAPAGANGLSFWYRVVCPDSITYDWATATLTDNTSGGTTVVVPKTCTNTGNWTQAQTSIVPSHNYTLRLISHDDNYAGDATYTLYDDVALSVGPPGGSLTNGGFETGSLAGWTRTGVTSITTVARVGSYAAVVGATSPTNGDSTISQTFTAPASATTISFWYAVNCPDTITYDWAGVQLKDNTTGTTSTLVPKTCPATYQWTHASATIVGGHIYTLRVLNHDDNFAGDPTYTLVDDVTVQ